MKLFSLEASNLGAAVAKERAKSDEVVERRLNMGVSLRKGCRRVVFLNAGCGRGGAGRGEVTSGGASAEALRGAGLFYKQKRCSYRWGFALAVGRRIIMRQRNGEREAPNVTRTEALVEGQVLGKYNQETVLFRLQKAVTVGLFTPVLQNNNFARSEFNQEVIHHSRLGRVMRLMPPPYRLLLCFITEV
jgi:hypothetical protein